jgi:hypothetical protein
MGNGQQQMVLRVPLAGQCGTVQQVINFDMINFFIIICFFACYLTVFFCVNVIWF